ncbi:hypothetical protein, partial [Alkalilacustris brevis]|uniref:hypothetical protein n=1 Tax=Alkalilacustris brevis TaxID=2026338 RepID=UPI001EE406D1
MRHPGVEPCIGGPRCGDPSVELLCFMPANALFNWIYAPGSAKSPCRGAARRCAAAFGLDSAQGAC